MIFDKLIQIDFLKMVQTIFYLTGTIITIITYKSLKKGLLNTVYTDYHKRIFDRIDNLSSELISEFSEDSENHWSKNKEIEKILNMFTNTISRI